MKIHPDSLKTALVLPGGGARGAFQVGVLRAIAEMLPHGCVNPFPIISGTSAGAINSVVLASKARRFRVAVAELEQVWGHFHCDQVFRTDNLTMLKSSLHWFAAIILGGMLVGTPRSLLDNSPLRSLLSRNVRFPRIADSIDRGHLHARPRSTRLPAALPPGPERGAPAYVAICTWTTSWRASRCR